MHIVGKTFELEFEELKIISRTGGDSSRNEQYFKRFKKSIYAPNCRVG